MQVNHRGSQEMHELHVRIEELEAQNAKLVSDLRNAVWTDSEHCKLLEVENARLLEALGLILHDLQSGTNGGRIRAMDYARAAIAPAK